MNIVEEFPHPVKVIENVWIPLSDGCRLAARIWLPEDAAIRPVPAILEYIPYRKRDLTRNRDEPMHHYFAGHGYAAVRVDLRGSGDSDGVLLDEYLPQEQFDAVEVIDWIAAQPWCSGKVGMMGISWGGFNALQVAALQPEKLSAIITLCSTDDRYADDAHYMGGCLLNENLLWGSILFTLNAFPPDPELVGERWRTMWQQRLENVLPFPGLWLEHQQRDDYWKQGSVCEDFSQIRCPVYAVGGWADGYTNAVGRLMKGLLGPRKGLIGPWGHAFPHDATPGPSIGFLQEVLRWWDYWLKDIDNGIMHEPPLRIWQQESIPSPFDLSQRPGRWIAEREWPSVNTSTVVWYLTNDKTLSVKPITDTDDASLLIRSSQATGFNSGDWCGFGAEGGSPADQRADDGQSLCFDSAVLAEALTILGSPELELNLSCDRPLGMLVVRLNDVADDGSSLRVSYGLLNLSHRDSHEHPEVLQPDQNYRITLKLNDCAHVFHAGRRLRIALSTSYWPIAWPAPEPFTINLHIKDCRLRLPVRHNNVEDDDTLSDFKAPEAGPALQHTALRPARYRRTLERDLLRNETLYTISSDGGDFDGAALARVHDIELDVGHVVTQRFAINDYDPLSARAEIVQQVILRRPGWNIRINSRSRLSATPDAFILAAEVEAFEDDESIFSRHWDQSITRHWV